MKIFHVVTSLDPRTGGPARSVPALVSAERALGHDVQLLTLRRAGELAQPEPPSFVQAFPRGRPDAIGRSAALHRHLRDHPVETLHHHGLWHRNLHYSHAAARLHHVPLVVSPRGMMMPWAWNHHRRRKSNADRLLHPGALHAVAGWHATSDQEADAIRELGFSQPICVVPNGVDIPDPTTLADDAAYWHDHDSNLAGRRVALFYSRFHAKKRIIECIDLWLQSAPPEWVLLVVGIPDQFTVKNLEEYVTRMGGRDRIRIHDGSYRPTPYAVAELFLLPSHSENFGMVVAEALAAGVPAIVAEGSPWQGLNDQGAGWYRPWLDFPDALKDALACAPSDLAERGARGRTWMHDHFSWQRGAARLLSFYGSIRQNC